MSSSICHRDVHQSFDDFPSPSVMQPDSPLLLFQFIYHMYPDNNTLLTLCKRLSYSSTIHIAAGSQLQRRLRKLLRISHIPASAAQQFSRAGNLRPHIIACQFRPVVTLLTSDFRFGPIFLRRVYPLVLYKYDLGLVSRVLTVVLITALRYVFNVFVTGRSQYQIQNNVQQPPLTFKSRHPITQMGFQKTPVCIKMSMVLNFSQFSHLFGYFIQFRCIFHLRRKFSACKSLNP